jgi:hypothetical protein
MSVHLQAIRTPTAPAAERRRADHAREEAPAEAFAASLRDAVRPRVPEEDEAAPGDARRLPGSGSPVTAPDVDHATEGNEVRSVGTLSDDPHTKGMYVPPDFYHGKTYSPVFDRKDENGNWVPTPRFEGQKIISQWRGSLPDDFDPNARVAHDPLNWNQSSNYWRQNESGDWVLRDTAYGGIPLNDDGKPIFTPDASKYPEYYASAQEPEEEA